MHTWAGLSDFEKGRADRTAAELGMSVCVLDEQPRAGGQIYRDVERAAGLRGDDLEPFFLFQSEPYPLNLAL